MRFFRKDEGFTLVELMVVVLIIGILIAIAVPVFNSARANAQRRSCQANQRTYEGAYQTWYADDPGNAALAAGFGDMTDTDGVLIPQFVKASPECPGGGAYSVAMQNNGLTIDLQCDLDVNNDGTADHIN